MEYCRHKWGKIGPSHFLNENGDLSFFFETVPGREHSGKVSKKIIGNFYFWGTTLNSSRKREQADHTVLKIGVFTGACGSWAPNFSQFASKTKKEFELNRPLSTVTKQNNREDPGTRYLTYLVTGNEQKRHAMVTQSWISVTISHKTFLYQHTWKILLFCC